MIRVLFVCHGNICRSPMAEFVLRAMVRQRGLADQFVIASAATSTEEIWNGIGNPVYPPAKRELAKHGISCEGKRAVQLVKADYDAYDYLLAMDETNLRHMERITGHARSDKMHLLMDYTEHPHPVADPWYSGRFDIAYQDIEEGCRSLLDYF